MKPVVKNVDITDIRIDGDTQMRKDVNPAWIQGIIDNLKNDIEYDPIEARFDGTHYWLSDGFHRYHAQSRMGLKTVMVAYTPGSREDARMDAFKANVRHGLPLSREDKIFKVEQALKDPLHKDKSDREIAALCVVSRSLVGAVRRPETKEKQIENRNRYIQRKAEEQKECHPMTPNTQEKPLEVPVGGEVPDEAELRANEAQYQADREMLAKFLDADDKVKHLYAEVKRLTNENVGFELRIKELMNEKNAAIEMAQKLQKQLDKLKAKK